MIVDIIWEIPGDSQDLFLNDCEHKLGISGSYDTEKNQHRKKESANYLV